MLQPLDSGVDGGNEHQIVIVQGAPDGVQVVDDLGGGPLDRGGADVPVGRNVTVDPIRDGGEVSAQAPDAVGEDVLRRVECTVVRVFGARHDGVLSFWEGR